jgi:hypothetical protein
MFSFGCKALSDRKRALERPRRIWYDSVMMYLREIGWGGVRRIHLAQDRDRWWVLMNTVMNFRVAHFVVHLRFLKQFAFLWSALVLPQLMHILRPSSPSAT